MARRRDENQGNNISRRRTPSGGWISHSLRRRKHNDRSPINPLVKYILFLFNFIFMGIGIAVMYIFLKLLVDKGKKINTVIDFLFDPSCLILVPGFWMFFIATFGCVGALRENTFLLKGYHILLAIFFLLEIIFIGCVFVFFFVDDAFAEIGNFENVFEDAISDYRNDPDVQGSIDTIQDVLSCCGASKDEFGYKDWDANIYFRCNDSNLSPEACSVPFSCCDIKDGDNINYQCGFGMLKTGADTSGIYVNGCLKGLQVAINDNIWIFGGSIIAILLPQSIFIFLAKGLVAQIEEQKMKW